MHVTISCDGCTILVGLNPSSMIGNGSELLQSSRQLLDRIDPGVVRSAEPDFCHDCLCPECDPVAGKWLNRAIPHLSMLLSPRLRSLRVAALSASLFLISRTQL